MRNVPPSRSSRRRALRKGLRSGALEREAAQRDARLLAELDEREAEVGVVVQRVLPDLVEDGTSRVVVAALQEAPDEVAPNRLRPHRIAERDPRAPPHAVHEEAGPRLVEEQRLVAHEGEEGEGRALRGDRRARPPRAPRPWAAAPPAAPGAAAASPRRRAAPPSRPTEARRKRGASCSSSNRHHRSWEYSTCLKEKRPSHTDAATTDSDGQRPAGREAPVEEGGPAVEGGSARREREQDEAPGAPPPRSRRPSAARPRSRGRARAPRGSRPRRAGATRRARRGAARPPRGCRGSARPRGAAAAGSPTATRRRPGADGVAPEKRSTAPARKVNAARSRGATARVDRAERSPSHAICARRSRHLVRDQQRQRRSQRQQVVDGAVEHEGRQDRRRGQVGLQGEDHERLEDPEPARARGSRAPRAAPRGTPPAARRTAPRPAAAAPAGRRRRGPSRGSTARTAPPRDGPWAPAPRVGRGAAGARRTRGRSA